MLNARARAPVAHEEGRPADTRRPLNSSNTGQSPLSKNGAEKQAVPPSEPCVRVVRRGLSVHVWIANAPWGVGPCQREFIGRRDTLANQYAEALQARLDTLAATERERRGRELRGRQQEREASIARLVGMAREAFG